MRKQLIVIVWGLVLTGVPASAQTTWYVDDDACPGPGTGTAGDPYCSIQDGIVAASGGDIVEVAAGTYYESIDFLGKAITVRSTDPGDPAVVLATIIDGTGHLHVVQCVSGETSSTVLSGFVITGGDANGGSSPDSTGGGMLNMNSSPTVMNCTFSGNSGTGAGGGMANLTSNATVTNCMFSGNTSASAGGMYNDASNTTVSNCTFSGNYSTPGGGAGMFNRGGSPTVEDCVFNGNIADGGGGGLCNYDYCNSALIRCTFSGNTAGTGGAVYTYFNYSTPSMAGTLFCNNTPDHITGESLVDNGGNIFSAFCAPPIPPVDSCPADNTGNGTVDVVDLLALLGSWGACP